ncbi:MAG: hypothetical protein DWP98_00545 [Bacteroidetes bacterium]|nr:MAG: hypothetical protein DWP98_00545 [Bacteroidota bacterium]MBL1143320.1 hypothetical protein [Bacteroidota bacterium]NOG56122.1 T9SS type B sorting domain-containing protein [Bacteroidota bacterium]
MKKLDNIEELFRETFKGFEADPGAKAWSSIQSQLNAPIANASVSAGSNSGILATAGSKIITAIIAASILGISVGAYFYFNPKAENQKTEQVKIEAKTVIEQEPTTETKVTPVIQELSEESIETTTKAENKKVQINTAHKEEAKPTETIKKVEEITSSIIADEVNEATKNTEKTEGLNKKDNQANSDIKPEQASKSINTNPEKQEPNIVESNPSNRGSHEDTKPVENIDKVSFIVPNIFTPNQDGVNDVFNIEDDAVENLRVQIFTKSGKLIHEWSGNYGFWDGTLPNGSIAPNDVYVYQISGIKSGQEINKRGLVTLTR